MQKDYYTILGVSPEASEEEIRSAFETLSAKLDDDGQADELLADLEEAYVVLSDPKSRAEYNRLYKIFGGLTRGFDGVDSARLAESGSLKGLKLEHAHTAATSVEESIDLEFDLDDLDNPGLTELINALKSTIFNLINGQDPQTLKDGAGQGLGTTNIYLDWELNPKELKIDAYKSLDYHCLIQCSDCYGMGSHRGAALVNCSACNNLKNKAQCLVCAGLGQYPQENCSKCKGEGRVMARRQVEVKIPKNVQHDSIIQVAGAGHRGFRGLKNGDLFIKVLLARKDAVE
ncbi:MAG: DnaJ domain-containing protein [bacterium]|nr:DnaJ domain-containing protein [bacterium]